MRMLLLWWEEFNCKSSIYNVLTETVISRNALPGEWRSSLTCTAKVQFLDGKKATGLNSGMIEPVAVPSRDSGNLWLKLSFPTIDAFPTGASLDVVRPTGQEALWSGDGASPLATYVLEIQSGFLCLFISDVADLAVVRVDLHCSRARSCVRDVVLLSPL